MLANPQNEIVQTGMPMQFPALTDAGEMHSESPVCPLLDASTCETITLSGHVWRADRTVINCAVISLLPGSLTQELNMCSYALNFGVLLWPTLLMLFFPMAHVSFLADWLGVHYADMIRWHRYRCLPSTYNCGPGASCKII